MPAARIQPQGRVRVSQQFARAPALVVSGKSGAAFVPRNASLANYENGPQGIGFRSTGAANGLAWSTADTAPISGAMPRTLFARVKINANNGNTSILAIGNSNTNSLFSFELYGGNIILHWVGSFVTAVPASAMVAGGIYDIAATYDGSTVRAYGGGKLNESATLALNTTVSPLFIGGSGDFFGVATDATLAVGGIIARCLSPQEVATLSANPWQVFDAPAPMLFAASAPAVLLAMSETGAASDGSSATVVSAAAAAEAGAASDISQSTKATPATITEVGAGADATTGAGSTVAANADALAAADLISTGAMTSAASVESGAAVDISSALSAGIAAVVETGAATDARSAVAALAAVSTETLVTADASSTSGAATGVSTVEAGSATEATGSTQQGIAATFEAAAASDTPGAVMATTAGRSDALAAIDLQQTGGTIISASVAESGAVAEFVLASYMLAAQAIEGASASDWLACSFMGVASISESSQAIDITSGRWVTSTAVSDALAALATTTAQLGGQLKPNPHRTYVGRTRIRSITGATRIRSM